MLQLIIKGDPEAARAAADRHGVKIKIVRYLDRWREVVATADSADRDPIALAWFPELNTAALSPFADGTLLWWGEAEQAPDDMAEARASGIGESIR